MATTTSQSKPNIESVDTGITDRDTKTIAIALGQALSDSFILYLTTLGVHWNVVGREFYSLHKLTEAQYADLDAAIDQIAERIRALGYPAPASFGDFTKNSVLQSQSTLSTATQMLDRLVSDNEAIAKRMREFVAVADEADDVFTADMLTARIGQHEQNAWMLRSMRD